MPKTEVGIMLGDPSDKVYIQPPLEEAEYRELIQQGVINESQENLVVGKEPLSIIDIGPETAGLEPRRQRTYRTALSIVEVLNSLRGEVELGGSLRTVAEAEESL